MINALDINKAEFGILGSIVYAGLTVGASIATVVFEKKYLIKPALFLSLLLNAGAVFLFGISRNFLHDAGLRFMIGFFQVFSCIYMPVWTDSFANEKQKAVWLTFLILASPLGVIIGYLMTSYYLVLYKSVYPPSAM